MAKRGGSKGTTLTKREIALIAALYAEGKTDAEIGKIAGLDRKTLTRAVERCGGAPQVKAKKNEADEKVERSLFERANGYSHKAVKIFCNLGQIVEQEYQEHYPPDVTACIFWLCNRQPERWKNVQRIEATGANGGALRIIVE